MRTEGNFKLSIPHAAFLSLIVALGVWLGKLQTQVEVNRTKIEHLQNIEPKIDKIYEWIMEAHRSNDKP